ncbi:MAG: DUF2726 domain-containing protein [Rubrivivax sp.]
MDFLDPVATAAIGAAALLLLSLWVVRRRRASPRKPSGNSRPQRQEALDTVAAWPPEAARVLTVSERQAYELLRRALPGFMVLAQVPLSRFVRVPTRNSYTDWMQRVGQLSGDLVLCDSGSRVMAVVDIRSRSETERSKRRHERLARVLRAAGIRVHVWYEGDLPSITEVRTVLGASLGEGAAPAAATRSAPSESKSTPANPMPLIPVAEIEELLAEGDALDHTMEPVPSAFFDDMEAAPTGARR